MIVALAGAVLAGCSEDFMSEAVLQPEVPTVRLAVDHAETRASLDGVSVSWEAGDKISVNGTTYTLQGANRKVGMSMWRRLPLTKPFIRPRRCGRTVC